MKYLVVLYLHSLLKWILLTDFIHHLMPYYLAISIDVYPKEHAALPVPHAVGKSSKFEPVNEYR